ncbi:hypothetical protein M0813_16112 [Anaeramoeba flamelloides]|uniref:BTB domain-containing protein n=1 Tax=Anaeramoeba flamelloides TaxID=1746091 RepID=A0ABQ8Z0L8_9EUKA|nr:hypothetical protein M0813_16112 [Anaeramoeba flamelloides]
MYFAIPVKKKVTEPIVFSLHSAGFVCGNYSNIFINGVDYSFSKRGFNIVLFDPLSKCITYRACFDTWGSRNDVSHLVEFIKWIPIGTIVLISIKDEATKTMTTEAVSCLETLGASDFDVPYRGGYVLIGRKGAKDGTGIQKIGTQKKPVSISNISDSYFEDFQNLLNNAEFTDLEIQGIKLHRQILSCRVGESKINALIELLEEEKPIITEQLINWVYCRSLKDSADERKIEGILREIGIDYEEKSTEYQFVKDINSLYENKSSFDYSIKLSKTPYEINYEIEDEEKESEKENENENEKEKEKEKEKENGNEKENENEKEKEKGIGKEIKGGDEEIKTHKIILHTRSNLFRGLFLNTNKENSIRDLTGWDYETLIVLIKFMYTDYLDISLITSNNLETFEEMIEYYQLNTKSSLYFYLDLLPFLNSEFKQFQPKQQIILKETSFSFYAYSSGTYLNPGAHLRINGKKYNGHLRGLHILVFDPKTKYIDLNTSLDFYDGYCSEIILENIMNILPIGRIVMLATFGNCSYMFVKKISKALELIGGSKGSLSSHGSYALIGIKGALPGTMIEMASKNPEPVEIETTLDELMKKYKN